MIEGDKTCFLCSHTVKDNMESDENFIDPENEVKKLQELVKKLEKQNELLRSKQNSVWSLCQTEMLRSLLTPTTIITKRNRLPILRRTGLLKGALKM